jgi:tetratricopeptide (TPR) repeat protein
MMVPQEFDLETALPNKEDMESNVVRNRLLKFHTHIDIVIGNLHRLGYNIRQIGSIAYAAWEHLNNEKTPGGLKGILRVLILTLFREGISRTLKNMLFGDLRIFFRTGGDYMNQIQSFHRNISTGDRGFVEVMCYKLDEFYPRLRDAGEKFSLNVIEELRSETVFKRLCRLTGICVDSSNEMEFSMLPKVQMLTCLEIAHVESLSREADEAAASRDWLNSTTPCDFERVVGKCVDAILAIQKHICEAPLISSRLQDLCAKMLSQLQFYIGVRYHAQGKYEASVDILRKALHTDRQNIDVMYHLAKILEKRGEELQLAQSKEEAHALRDLAKSVGDSNCTIISHNG